MLQTAALAEAGGAHPALVAAALLHDIGHFTGPVSGNELMTGVDNHHCRVGADLLAMWFPAAVTEPVRLHVAAKRYLCATDAEYYDRLSPASRFTLEVQGGPFTTDQAVEFADRPYALDAVRLRQWDDAAKVPGMAVPAFAHYEPMLYQLCR
jgi:gamma-butyrobetaine dioxygenase